MHRPVSAGVLLALLAATPAGAEPAKVPPPPSEVYALPVTPQRVMEAISRLDGLADDMLRRSGVPGMAVAVAYDDDVVYARGFGVRQHGEPAPVDADTVFQLASVSKSVGATVVAAAVGRGIVGWDTPVVEHLPWFALADPWVSAHVTIGDLYAHRSGLPDHAGDALEDLGYGRREILERLKLLPLAPFRAHYAYTNFGLTAAAEAVAAAAGTDWAALSEETLYEPLGMKTASSHFADFMARKNRAVGHARTEDGFRPLFRRQPDEQSPAGGVSASVNDLARWMLMVLGGGRLDGRRVVSEAALLPALSPHVVSSPPRVAAARASFYGYGFGVGVTPSGHVELSHSGAFELGAATNFRLLPAAGLGIAVLTNAAPAGLAESLSAAFLDLVLFGEVERDWLPAYASLFAPMAEPVGELAGKAPPERPAPAAALDAYAGTYANAYFGDATVADEGGRLLLMLGPGPDGHDLRHWDGDVFVFAPRGENAPEGSLGAVTFERDGGTVSAFTVDYLDENGLGRFERR